MTITVEPLTGAALVKALPDLARLRITVFREWPYLYDGSEAYEQRYLDKFSRSQNAVIVAARDGDSIIGLATAAPMAGHVDAFADEFRKRGLDPERIFYFGESVLLKSYRGRGIGHAFFDHREAHARRQPGVTHITFCAVMRPEEHPLNPGNYFKLDAFWRKRGYRPVEGLVGNFGWKDIGDSAETMKPMQFWMRAL